MVSLVGRSSAAPDDHTGTARRRAHSLRVSRSQDTGPTSLVPGFLLGGRRVPELVTTVRPPERTDAIPLPPARRRGRRAAGPAVGPTPGGMGRRAPPRGAAARHLA